MSETSAAETGAKEEAKQESFFKNLLNRRVPQILGIYIAAGWGIVQFVDWLVNRYLLSPNLVDLALVVLLSLIPSSMIIAYHHGKPGRDKWKKPEKVGIPLNVVFSFLLVFFLFQEKDLSKVSQTVTLQDESGKKIERTIPKSQFRKKIALFYFKNETGDKSLDWLQTGLTQMLEFDLSQDMFIDMSTPHSQGLDTLDYYVYAKMKEAGYKDGTGLPLLLQKKIAEESHMDYFLSGKIMKDGENFVLENTLYHTKDAKPAAKNTFRGTDIFKLIDDSSVRLKHDLEIPKGHIESVDDLPVAESFTNSLPAARLHTLGSNAVVFEQNWVKAQEYFEESVRVDPTFAVGYGSLVYVYLLTNQTEKYTAAFKPLMQHNYKLPEQRQLYTKIGYYQSKGEPDKMTAILKMIIKLYPEDIKAYSILAFLYNVRNQLDDAIASYKRILEIDPRQYAIYEKIGNIYEQKGELDQALNYYEKFVESFPENPDSFKLLGGYHKRTGNFEQAKDYYEKALLLKPENIDILTSLAETEGDLGNIDKAIQQCNEALQLSKTPETRQKVYRRLFTFHNLTGQMKKALEYGRLRIEALKEYAAPLLVLAGELEHLEAYVWAGKPEEAFKRLDSLGEGLQPPFDKWLSLGFISVYLELEKPGEAEKRLPDVQELITSTKQEQYRIFYHYSQGMIHRLRDEYTDALKSYEAVLKVAPSASGTLREAAICYRHLKQYQKAEEFLEKALKIHPFNPSSNYELALVYLDKGDKEKAVEHLKIAANIWKDADPHYRPAQSAKEKLAELD
jgi:tetratricopeptide (TPR) repeat protein